MFRIHELMMMNFARFKGVTIPLDGETTVITGRNGSGKSTTMDAARLALGSRKLADESREMTDYLRDRHSLTLVAIVAENQRGDERPPAFRRLGFKEEFVTLARVFEPKTQGYRSRYVLADGKLSPDEIFDQLDAGDDYGETRYLERLQTIGITRSGLDQLIIRQGKVKEIIDSTPRRLYQTVLEHAGATGVIEEYRRAKDASDRARRELDKRREDLHSAQIRLRELEDLAEERRRYDERRKRVASLREQAEAARTQGLIRKKVKLDEGITELEEDLGSISDELEDLAPRIEELEATVEEKEGELQGWDETTASLRGEHDEVRREKETLEEAHTAYQLAKRELPGIEKLPATESLTAAVGELKTEWSELDEKARRARRAFSDQEDRVTALQEGKVPWPPAVRDTLTGLSEAGIQATCIADALDPDPGDKTLLEGALGPRRFALHVQAEDLAQALTIARENGFPGPIAPTNGDTLDGSEATVWRSNSPVPRWLTRFDVRDGHAWSEEGAWVTTERDTVTGVKPTPEEIESAEAERDNLEAAWQDAKQVAHEADQRHEEARNRLESARRRDAHVETVETAGDLPGTYARLDERFQRLEGDLRLREERRAQIGQTLQNLRNNVDRDKGRSSTLTTRQYQKQKRQEDLSKGSEKLTSNIRSGLAQLREEWRQKAEDLEHVFADPGQYEGEAKDLEADLDQQDPPEPGIHAKARSFKGHVDSYRNKVEDQQEEVEKTIERLDEARRQYAMFANQHIRTYEKRVRTIAKEFGARVGVSFTAITEESEDDQIDRAILEVRFGYDQKEPTLVHGTGFSGGQKVLNGLILQLALQDADQDGFIMVDQPYDHLDEQNAMEVAEHLARTTMQVIIVVPSSLNPSHYHGMTRGVLFHRATGEGWANPPEVVALREPPT